MKQLTIILTVIAFCFSAKAQKRFIKEIVSPGYGASIRVLPMADLGWVVCSMDSLHLTRFNGCGEPEWSKKYQLPNVNNGLNDFIKTQDGGFALMTRIPYGSIHGTLLTKMDSLGNILWSREVSDASYNHVSYTLSQDQQGNFIIFGNVAYYIAPTVYNMMCKISNSGNLIFTRYYNYGSIWGGAIVTADNGVLMRTGWIFIKTDNAGNVQWTTQVLTSGYHYLAPVEVSDGYIFTDYNNTTNAIEFCKLDKQGNLLWGGRKTSNYSGTPPKLIKKSNGNFVGVFNYTTVVEFDKDLNVVAQSRFNTGSFSGTNICFLADGTPVLGGLNNSNAAFARMDPGYGTPCDVAGTPMTFTPGTATASFINTIVTNYSMNIVARSYTVDTVAVSMNVLCFVPKALNLGSDTLLCKGTTLTLQNQTGDWFDHYQWSTGETTASITINQPGTYWLLVNDDCRENRFNDTVWITINPAVEADLGADLFLCENTSQMLFAPDCDSCTFEWSTGSHADSIEVNEQGAYWLVVKNNNGCISRDTLNVAFVKCECEFYIPKAFTPNSDGKNELFKPVYYCDMEDYNLKVFNRWGELVYNSSNKEAGWDGRFNNRQVQSGVYMYVVNYTPLIKAKLTNRVTKSGTVVVVY